MPRLVEISLVALEEEDFLKSSSHFHDVSILLSWKFSVWHLNSTNVISLASLFEGGFEEED